MTSVAAPVRRLMRSYGDLKVYSISYPDRFPVGYVYEVDCGDEPLGEFETVGDLLRFLRALLH